MIVKNYSTQEEGTGKFELVKAGTHIAVCYAVIDLGMQPDRYAEKKGEKRNKHEILYAFEISDDTVTVDGKEKPKILTKRMTLSVNASQSRISYLRKMLTEWRHITAEQFDEGVDVIAEAIGKPAMISVTHAKKADGTGEYDQIESVTELHPAIPTPKQINESVTFEFPTVSPNEIAKMSEAERKKVLDAVEKIPTTFKMRNRVKDSETYKLYSGENAKDGKELLTEVTDEILPF